MGNPTLLSTTLSFAVIAASLLAGCGQTAPGEPASSLPPFKPVADLHEVMHDVIFPSAEVVWKSVGTIISYEGNRRDLPKKRGGMDRCSKRRYDTRRGRKPVS